MKRHIAVLTLGLLVLQCGDSLEVHRPRVAIIGGGIGGASASHFLTELLNGSLKIDLYEAETIGGRLATIKIDNNEVEAGGAIIHPKNMYMQKFVKLLGLEHKSSSDQKNGIWNGDKFVYEDSSYYIVSLSRLLYRYGFQLLELTWYINNIIEDFGKIYDLQDAGRSFANVSALLAAMNEEFPKLLQIPIKDQLLQKGFTNRLIDEMVQTAIVVNYGQETDIQSFVGLVALAGVGADLWSVKGGNKGVPEHLIYRNKNINVIPSRVTKIRNIQKQIEDKNMKQYEVTFINKDSTDPMTSDYDIIIIAAPLTSDQKYPIEFVQFPDNFAFPGNYQTTYATFVKANLNPKYFGLQETLNCILSCNPNKTIISSVGEVNSVDGLKANSGVWKIFSRKPLESSLVHEMFSNIIEKKEIAWKAYPHYSTNVPINDFKLYDALYYVNAIEWSASAMEMSAIGGRNVAILAYNDFLQKYNYISNKNAYEEMPTTKKFSITDEL